MEIISRDRWGSVSKWKFGNMVLPAQNIYIHHTVTPFTDFPYKDAKLVESVGIQRFGQMSYSYVIHPNGTILEGAGIKTGAHTEGRNSTGFGIGLIGDYSAIPATDFQIRSVRWLIFYLKNVVNYLNDSAVLTPHNSLSNTICPGNGVLLKLNEMRTPWVPEVPLEIAPMFDPPIVLEPIAAELEHNGGLYLAAPSGALYAFGGAPPIRGANGQSYFVNRRVARLFRGDDPVLPDYARGAANGVSIQTTSNEWYGPFLP